MDYKELYELWLTNPYFDEDTRKELEAIKDDNKEIEDRFYKDLEFGTAKTFLPRSMFQLFFSITFLK